MELKKTFEPIKIGKMEVKNRFVMAPIDSKLGNEWGAVTQRHIDYLVARAKGGVGLIIMDNLAVEYPRGKVGVMALRIDQNKVLPRLNDLAEEVHVYGAKIAAQICHSGRQTKLAATEGEELVSCSDVPYVGSGAVPRPLTVVEIEELVEKFAQAAWRVKAAGFDAVEIHSAHGYLLSSFLSPFTNKRTDWYGGDTEGRMRFLLEIVARSRVKVGDDFPIIVRINGSDFVEGGLTLEESKVIAQELEKAGVDAIDVSAGTYESDNWTFPTMAMEAGALVYLAEGIKSVVHIPVIAVGKIATPELAEKIVKEGKADMVALGRPLLADPEYPKKAEEGRLEDIRPCIFCNQGCIGLISLDLGMRCNVNAALGREREYEIRPAERVKNVLVVGGGPAGLEAARVAGLRGHKVILYEKNSGLGGQMLLASAAPFKKDIKRLVDYYVAQMKKAKIEVNLGQELTADMVEKIGPDVVILATGAEPLVPDVTGVGGENVVTANDVLGGVREVKDRAVVAGGGMVGCEVAALLAQSGKKVTVVEILDDFAIDMPSSIKKFYVDEFAKHGVAVLTESKIEEISERCVVVAKKDWQKEEIEAETVVLALGSTANKKLLDDLKGKVPELYSIGDCVEPRTILEAVAEGARVGYSI